jgi:hypothetical protein
MGQPDGGWYDETPPRVIGSTPADRATHINQRKAYINFSEFIKIENATENVIVSPPQLEQPDIKAQGRRIVVELKDSLKPNTTYTIDFSDAITDNNENNPLGNYTYTFSTGDAIDTLEVSGHVVQAQDLEPLKGIQVGLYRIDSDTIGTTDTDTIGTTDSDTIGTTASDTIGTTATDTIGDAPAIGNDTLFTTTPFLRVSRTDSRGHFVIRGVAPGNYRIFALQDADGNYMKSQRSETLAFTDDIITPSFKDDIRQDTIWRDSLRIERIERVGYTHFLPDDIILRAFTEEQTDRYLLKTERQQPELLRIYFSNGADTLPTLRGLDFDTDGAFVIETSAKNDTINYWLRDTLLVNRDTLTAELTYMATDTAGLLQQQTDTITFIPKQSYERRKKEQQKQIDEWLKAQEKKKKKGQPYDSIMPTPHLEMKLEAPAQLDPDRNITITFPTPLATIDTSAIHLYAKHDTLWYVSRFQVDTLDTYLETRYQIRGEWRPEVEYSLEFDSLAFTDIYGHTTDKRKAGFKVRGLDEYAVIMLTLTGFEGKPVIAQLIDNSDKVVKQTFTETGVADFYYVEPHTYYLRMFVDENRNGRWDTGDYDLRRQAEAVYYYPKEIECRAKWDLPLTWNPTATPVEQQKPSALIKQKSEKRRNVKSRNLERARQKGIPVSEIPEKY